MSINLLPPQSKTDIVFARRNAILRGWIIASLAGLMGIVIVLAAGSLFMSRSTSYWQKQVTNTKDQLNAQKQDDVQKQVTNISDSIKLTLQVLQQQVFFSKLLTQVGAAMPPGTSLSTLTINSLQGGIDISALATDYQSATQVQVNLTDPSRKLFDKADIINTNCGLPTTSTSTTTTTNTLESQYPCKISIRAVFVKNSNFQYASSATQGAK